MVAPELPSNESQRQAAVDRYAILDTLPEDSYDNITALMAYVCDAPISLITLLDHNRNWLKSHHGVPLNESPREISFCGHAINSDEDIFIVEDARTDHRFCDNPLVSEHQAIFYAGVPLVDADGYKLGTLCVYDNKPRVLNDAQQNALISMSKQVIHLFERHLKIKEHENKQDALLERNREMSRFARVVSHDLKSPVTHIVEFAKALEEDNANVLDAESLQYLKNLRYSSLSLRRYIDGLLDYYTSDEILLRKGEIFLVSELGDELTALLDPDDSAHISFPNIKAELFSNKSAILQILLNLLDNAIKYSVAGNVQIEVRFEEHQDEYLFQVIDSGMGIPEDKIETVFELFTVTGNKDKHGSMGTGIGLSTVKKMVEKLGGSISVESEVNHGSRFSFSIKKSIVSANGLLQAA